MNNKNIAGLIILAAQAIASAVLIFLLLTSKMLPSRYLFPAVLLLVLLLGLDLFLCRRVNKAARFAGVLLGIFFSGMIAFAALSIQQVNNTLETIAITQAPSSEMVIAVRAEDPAESIEDTADYLYGSYEQDGRTQAAEVVDELTSLFGSEPATRSYDTPLALASALLDGEIDALIYDGAYTDLLDDVMENYSDQIKILHTLQVAADETADAQEDASSEDTAAASQALTDRSFTVYISGIDVTGPISTTSRSDVNILMTVNPAEGRILLTTTPRDYYVTLPGISGEKRDKLTHAGIYGINASMAALENLYGIDLDYYVRINFDSLISLVDALGGVDVQSEYAFSAGGYSFSSGTNHLNGDQALAFSRERYSFSGGDNQRGQNQMLVLTGIIEKLQSPAVLGSAGALLDVVQTSMQTNIPKDEITNFIAFQLSDGPSWKIDRQAVSGSGDKQETYSMPGSTLYVMWPDEGSVEEASAAIRACLQGEDQ